MMMNTPPLPPPSTAAKNDDQMTSKEEKGMFPPMTILQREILKRKNEILKRKNEIYDKIKTEVDVERFRRHAIHELIHPVCIWQSNDMVKCNVAHTNIKRMNREMAPEYKLKYNAPPIPSYPYDDIDDDRCKIFASGWQSIWNLDHLKFWE